MMSLDPPRRTARASREAGPTVIDSIRSRLDGWRSRPTHTVGQRWTARLAAGLVLVCLATPCWSQTPPDDRAAPEGHLTEPLLPGAYETLAAVRQAYRSLDNYQDHGELERRVDGRREQLYFSTAARPGEALVFRSVPAANPSHERVLWLEDGLARVYDRRLDQVKAVDSLAAELAHGFGVGGFEALVVPALLAGSTSALGEPEGIALEGPEPCTKPGTIENPGPDDGCWLLLLYQMAGSLETQLWIDRDTHLIRRLQVLHTPLGSDQPPVTLETRHAIQPTDDTLVAESLAFVRPESARDVDTWDLSVLSDREDGAPVEQAFDIGFVDEITVEILSLPLRIVDSLGEPVRGLGPDDLRVRIGGKEVAATSLEWVSPYGAGGRPVATTAGRDSTAGFDTPTDRRPARRMEPLYLPNTSASGLKIFFVQTDFEPTRIRGHLRIRPLVEELLRSFHPDDRVAVLTFDSRLRLWLDFTTDRRNVGDVLYEAIKPGGDPRPRRPRRGPSLLEHLDLEAARQVAEPEKALALTANALANFPGPKEMIFVGWGLGLYRAGAVHMTPDFGKTMAALGRAEVTVFVLDVTEADFHALEAGLKTMAQTTGGTYQSTFHFASQATHRLARTLQGHYVLTIDRGAQPGLRGPLQVAVPGHRGEVLYRAVVLR